MPIIIVSANRALFFPPNIPENLLTIFIAWLNLDFGFETCFYNGMDEFAKTWLQLAFPAYIIVLFVLIMVISEYSQQFSKLIANKNPVATLATLGLLSFTKFLRLIINGASYARILHYSIGQQNRGPTSVDLVWRTDANLAYFEGRRMPLFVIVLLIALVSIFFMLLLLFWQCLQRFPNIHPFKIISNPKLKSFMDAYHAPFKDHHRYWTGLQLLVRIVLYVNIAVNDNSTGLNLLTVSLAAATLLMLANVMSGGIYKKWPMNVLETRIFSISLCLLSLQPMLKGSGRTVIEPL